MAEPPRVPGLCRAIIAHAALALALSGGLCTFAQGPGIPGSAASGPPAAGFVPYAPPGLAGPLGPPPTVATPRMTVAPAGAPTPLLGAVPALPPEVMVLDVRIEGDRTVPLDKIRTKIHTRPGRPYDPQQVQHDVRELNRARWFVDIEPMVQDVPGGVIVVFRVVERSLIRSIEIIGNKDIKAKTLKKEIDLKVGEAADPFNVEQGRMKIEEYYHKEGYSKARVTVLEGNKPNDLRVIYVVDEGPKQKVWRVKFVGNQAISGALLQTKIKSQHPYFYIFKGEVDRKQIDEDEKTLIAYYHGLGFLYARVGRSLEFNAEQNWLTLTFVIDEGPRYKVRNITFQGNTKISAEKLAEKIKLTSGQYFNQKQLQADVVTIQDQYGGNGYVFADVKPESVLLDAPGQLDLVYHVTEGDRYRVGQINVQIKGENPHTRLSTLLNRCSLKPGDIMDTREIRDTERRWKAAMIFVVDPMKGHVPKIVYSAPESEDKDKSEVAERPAGRQTSYYRGPVDDGPPPQNDWPPLPPGERYGNIVVQYDDWDQLRRAERAEAVAPPPNGPVTPRAAPLVVRGQMPGESGSSMPDLPPPAAAPNPTYAAPNPPYAAPVPPYAAPAPYAGGPANVAPAPGAPFPAPLAGAPGPAFAGPGPYAAGPANPAPIPPNAAAPANPAPIPPNAAAPINPAPIPPNAAAPMNVAPVAPYAAGPGPYAAGPPPAGPGMPAGPVWAGPGAPVGPFYPSPRYDPSGMAGTTWPDLPKQDRVFGDPNNYIIPPADSVPLRELPLGFISEETQTGRLMFGVGVNSEAGLVGQIVLDEQNFDWTRWPTGWEDIRNGTAWRGAGEHFRVELVPGTQVQRYMVSFQEPYLGMPDGTPILLDGRPVGLGLNGFYYERIYPEWREQRAGGGISFSYQFTHDLSGSIGFRGQNVKILNPEFTTVPDLNAVLGHNALYSFSVGLAHDTRDNAFLATEGHLLRASFEETVGTFSYPRWELSGQQFFRIYENIDHSGRHVLSLSATLAQSGSDTPIFERFYAGGFSTLRGFAFRGVSPRDPATGMVVGGDFELLTSIQYLFPITADDMLRGVFFVDAGTVEPSMRQWNENYRVAPGFGLRIAIPMMGPAPIALDFAFPVLSASGDQRQMFSFFVGFNH
jgi:outer membrane protein insertion porin family